MLSRHSAYTGCNVTSLSEARAITNFIGNGVATIWLANNEQAFNKVEEAETVTQE